MTEHAVLITGACGEIGQALLESLAQSEDGDIVTFDLHPLPQHLHGMSHHIEGDLRDSSLLKKLRKQYSYKTIFHLAATLSTTGERQPFTAHDVNVDGTMALMNLAVEMSQERGEAVKFLFPSSIAVYGLPDLETKKEYFHIEESEWNEPTTMYGCTKLYCEKVGRYFSKHYLQLDEKNPVRLDFRAIRFPGLISAFTVPSGGTSDYGPEMIHAAAQEEPYACFVRPDVRIPFMAMPDAVKALILLERADRENLRRNVYNVTSFNLSAGEFKDMVTGAFPGAKITFDPDEKRQSIVDSWPADLDDSAARLDWDWSPDFSAQRACEEYLLPNIKDRYA